MSDIVEKLLDLQKQATAERSHFYVASCITKAIQEIVSLRIRRDSQQPDTVDANIVRAGEICPKCGELKGVSANWQKGPPLI